MKMKIPSLARMAKRIDKDGEGALGENIDNV